MARFVGRVASRSEAASDIETMFRAASGDPTDRLLDTTWVYIAHVYKVLFCAVLLTITSGAGASLFVPPRLLPPVLLGALLGTALSGLSLVQVRNIPGVNVAMFASLCVAEGSFLGLAFRLLERLAPGVSLMAAGSALVMMAFLTAYVLVTRQHFSHWRGFLCTAVTVMLASSLIGIVIGASWVEALCNAAGVLVFGAGIVLDTSSLLDPNQRVSVIGSAVDLYLSVICLFLSLLDGLFRLGHGH